MKATINIPDDLYRQVKAEAALRGLTVREVTTRLYRRWLKEGEGGSAGETPAAWLHSWLDDADGAIGGAPPGPPAREELARDRKRLWGE